MPAATRLQDQHDVNVTPGASVDGFALSYDHASGKFLLPGRLTLPATTASVGTINVLTERFMHSYAHATADGENTFLGLRAGNFTQSPSGGNSYLASTNTGIGYQALMALTTGYHNTAVGPGALQSNTTGVYNTALGVHALLNNTTGNDNVAIGPGALQANTIADHNIAIGIYALTTNTDGAANVAIGSSALRALTTGSNNVAVGATAGTAITTGTANTAIGFNALSLLTTGSNNVAIGSMAGGSISTASGLTAVGSAALSKNTTGTNNAAFGMSALLNCTTGTDNAAFGTGALQSLLTGTYNVAMGTNALVMLTDGVRNSAIGYGALSANISAHYSVAVGFNALAAHSSGNSCTAIGTTALYSNVAGAGCVALGYSAGYYETGSNKLFIDNAARASEADGRVKALVYGVFDAVAANQSLVVNAGSFQVTAGGIVVNEDGNNSNSRIEGDNDANLLFVNAATDRIGIGTSAPVGKIDACFGGLGLSLGADAGVMTRTDATVKTGTIGAVHYTNAEEPVGLISLGSYSGYNTMSIGGGSSAYNAATYILFYTAANGTTVTGTERMRISEVGHVGIGSNSVASRLQVQENTTLTNTLRQLVTYTLNSTGTAAAGFGSTTLWQLESTTTDAQSAAAIDVLWYEATHASRKADLVLSAYDTAIREGIRIRGNGSAPAIGFFGHAPSAQPAAYTPSNVTPDRSFDADTVLVAELADVVGTLIADLQTIGLLA